MKNKELKVFHEIGKALTSSIELKDVLHTILDKITKLLHPQNWSLLLIDDEKNELFFEIVVGEKAEQLKDVRIKIGEGIAGWVAKEGKPLLVPNAMEDERFSLNVDQFSGFKTGSILCVPLHSKGKVLGVIELVKKHGRSRFDEDDLETLYMLSDYAAIAIENARYFSEVKKLTVIDEHTGLYNIRYLKNILSHEVKRGQRYKLNFSLIFLDLDFFKHVNDTYGHLIGSRLLKEVADLIVKTLRDSDVSVRYGGDEYIMFLPETSKENALIVANRLRNILNETSFIGDQGLNIKIKGSFGIATFPHDGKTPDELIRKSDEAMYKVKNSGRDGISTA